MIATIILICLLSGKFFIHAAKHGDPWNPKSKYNAFAALLYVAIQLTLYYYAGLFDKF